MNIKTLHKLVIFPNLLNKKQQKNLLTYKNFEKIDKYMNDVVNDELRFNTKYIECNTPYQILKFSNTKCNKYEYNLTTSELNQNWTLYVGLNTKSLIHFDALDTCFLINEGCGLLLNETDENFLTDSSSLHYIFPFDSDYSNVLVKKFF